MTHTLGDRVRLLSGEMGTAVERKINGWAVRWDDDHEPDTSIHDDDILWMPLDASGRRAKRLAALMGSRNGL